MTASATAYRCLKKRCSSFSLVEYTYNVCHHHHHHQQQHYTIIYSCVCNGRRKGWKAFHNRLQDRSATERSLRDFFDILRFYLLLLYPTCQILSATYFNSAIYHFRQQLVKCLPSK